MYSIKVPTDVSLVASGRTISERAAAYEDAARNVLGFSPAQPKNKLGDKVPDGIMGDTALEVKYVDDFSVSPRNPDYKIPYPNKLAEDDIAQAKKYDDAFADGVLWVTNSPDLASIYTSTFNAISLTKSRVVVIPSVRK